MGIFKWIKEGFGIWILMNIVQFMLIYSFISPEGMLGNLLVTLIFIPLGLINALMMPAFITMYTVIYRPGITIAIRVPLVILSILVYIFIRTPLSYVGASSKWLWDGLEDSIDNIIVEKEKSTTNKRGQSTGSKTVKRPKPQYLLLFAFSVFLSIYSFGLDFTTLTSLAQDAIFVSLPIVLFPLALTLIVSGISLKISGKAGSSESEEPAQASTNYAETAKAGYEAGKEAHGLYKDIQDPKKQKAMKDSAKKGVKYGKKGAELADKKVGNKGLQSIAKQLTKIPGMKGLGRSLLSVGAEGGGAVAGLSTILYLLIILLVLLLLWLFVAVIFWMVAGGLIKFILLPFLGETFGPAIGLTADYASYGGSELSGIMPNYDFTGEKNALKLAGARIGCALEGPACLREWQMNNSQRPGSESVGVKFGLEIEEFNVNQGNTIDIAGSSKNDSIPVTLQVYNTIQGLRGITAENARYRVNIYDGNTLICSSTEADSDGRLDPDDWNYLGGEFVRQDNNEGKILPGDFSNPSGNLDSLTIENCGLLQPALGEKDVTEAEVEIRYDYSSQSTLSFKAMSEQYRSESGIRKEVKPSETANTPVQTYVNVRSPVTFQEGENGRRHSEVFPVNIGFQTERFDTEYRIKLDDFKLHGSSVVEDVDTYKDKNDDFDTSLGCEDLEYHPETNVYTLSESKKDEINSTQKNSWYSRGFAPEATCYMVLKDEENEIDSISPTGETLNMRVDGNYTVKTISSTVDFDTRNTRCNSPEIECPLVVPDSQSESKSLGIGQSNYPKLRSDCDSSWSIDASRNGCTVVKNQEDWGNPEAINDRDENNFRHNIDNQETAYLLSEVLYNRPPSYANITRYSDYTDDPSNAAIGLRTSPREIEERGNAWFIELEGSSPHHTTRIFEREKVYCKGADKEDVLKDMGAGGRMILAAAYNEVNPSWLEDNWFYSTCPTEDSLTT